MLAAIKGDPNFQELIAPWLEAMEKQGKGLPFESLEDKQLGRIKELSGMLLNSVKMYS